MTNTRAYYEYVTITYNPLDPAECQAADDLLASENLEFRSRRPKVGKIILIGRREIEPPSPVTPCHPLAGCLSGCFDRER